MGTLGVRTHSKQLERAQDNESTQRSEVGSANVSLGERSEGVTEVWKRRNGTSAEHTGHDMPGIIFKIQNKNIVM